METQNGNEPTINGPGRFGSSRFCFGGNAPLAFLLLCLKSVRIIITQSSIKS